MVEKYMLCDTRNRHASTPCLRHQDPLCDIQCLPKTHIFAQICGEARLFLFTCKSKRGSDSSYSLSDSKFVYGDSGTHTI